jgi:hypothetical protein
MTFNGLAGRSLNDRLLRCVNSARGGYITFDDLAVRRLND